MIAELMRPILKAPVYISSSWISVKDNLDMDLERVIQYYKIHNGTVSNRALLARILDSIDVRPTSTISNADFLSSIKTTIYNLEKVFGISSTSNFGKVTPDYINNNINIYIAKRIKYRITDDISILDEPSMGVLDHNIKDLSMAHPTRYNGGNMIVYYIDLELLTIQYRTWLKNRTYGQSTNSETFIHDIVLTNTIRGFYNVSIRNIVFEGIDNIIVKGNSTILVSNHSSKVIKACEDVRKYLSSKPLDMAVALDFIPSVYKNTYYRYLQTTNTSFYNAYNRGTGFYLYLRLISLFFNIASKRTVAKNKGMLNRLKRKIKRFKGSQSDNKTLSVLKLSIELDTLYIIEELL